MIRAIISFIVLFAVMYFAIELYMNKFLFMKVRRGRIFLYALSCATLTFALLTTIVYLF